MTQFDDSVIDVEATVVDAPAPTKAKSNTKAKAAGTALTPVAEAAKQAIVPLEWAESEAGLAKLREELKGVQFDVGTEDGYKAARETLSRCVAIRNGAQEAYDLWNRPVMALQKKARTRRDELIEAVQALETPIREQVDAEKKRRDEEAVRKAREEAQRIEAHEAALKQISNAPANMVSASTAEISAKIAELTDPGFLPGRNWEEYAQQAAEQVQSAVAALGAHLENAKAREELARFKANQAREEEERQRVAALRERISNIQQVPTTCIGMTAEHIQRQLNRLEKTTAADFGDLATEAQAAIDTTRAALTTLHAQADLAESSERQRAADAAELQRLRDADAQRKAAEAEAAERKQREEREAREREQREAEERAEAARREQEAAAAALAARVKEKAARLLDLVTAARPHVAASALPGAAELCDSIDQAIADIEG
ncbi:hypothetical protein [Cupriavidus pauculus]|uniref:hypothetical protein n=1 Tax=Cupriavidus pauculus TaxID=82633 RepID=UPI001D0C585F|nr:hypothetical protein [Cupriavidus pauculus]